MHEGSQDRRTGLKTQPLNVPLRWKREEVQDYAVAASNYKLGKLATCIGYLYETDLRSKGVRNSGNVTDGELLKELIFKVIH